MIIKFSNVENGVKAYNEQYSAREQNYIDIIGKLNDKIKELMETPPESFRLLRANEDSIINVSMDEFVTPQQAINIDTETYCCKFSFVFHVCEYNILIGFELTRKNHLFSIRNMNTHNDFIYPRNIDDIVYDIGEFLISTFDKKKKKLQD